MKDGGEAALARRRREKVDRAVARAGVDLLVLLKSSNVRYATGARVLHTESSREAMRPAVVALAPGRGGFLATPDPDLAAGAEPLRDAFHPDDPPGAKRLAAALRDLAPSARRLAIDRLSAPLLHALRAAFPGVAIVDADALLGPERMVKLPEEIERLREAQRRNERAIAVVLERLRPGVRELDLTAAFHAGLGREDVLATHVESVWCAVPKRRSEAPFVLPGSFPYRELTSRRVLERDDLVIVDTGILHDGYMSDFGRTWPADPGRKPTDAERRLFESWREILERLLEACRPGHTALDLRRAALRGWRGPEPPWPLPLYVAHSIGLGGVEPPFVGTELGEAVEERWTLEPGMVIVFEPYVWEEGAGGYRAEETVVVIEGGCERLTEFGYEPFGEWASRRSLVLSSS